MDAKGDTAMITIGNVMQSNGVIQVINTVMLPGRASSPNRQSALLRRQVLSLSPGERTFCDRYLLTSH